LKTSEPVRLGSFTFKSTDDTTGLSDEDAAHVRDVAQMLFLKDHVRIRSASYAILPPLDLDKPELSLKEIRCDQNRRTVYEKMVALTGIEPVSSCPSQFHLALTS
jgi:hypothetical protein